MVLRGINALVLKSKGDIQLEKIVREQIDVLFKLSHHNVLRIQLQVLKLLFAMSKVLSKDVSVVAEAEGDAD